MAAESVAEDLLAPERAAFDIPRDRVWLNCAQMSAMHRDVRAAGAAAALRKASPWEATPESFFTEVEETRAEAAALIGADVDGVAIQPSASYGVATAARNLPLSRGGAVVIAAEQFPSNYYAWARKAEECGGRLAQVSRRSVADGWTAPLLEAIGADAEIVALGVVHWADGAPYDLQAIAARCREVGAALVLDGTQGVGAAPIDMAEIRPDFMACPSYKWLLGPYSLGFFYAAPHRRGGAPLEESWMNRADAAAFSTLTRYRDAYAEGARRYDMGEKANFTLIPMLLAALRLLRGWRVERIAATLAATNARLIAALEARGFAAPPPERRSPHYFGVRPPAGAPADLAARLAADKAHVSIRGDSMRVSPHLWIDAEDEARFLELLDRHLGR